MISLLLGSGGLSTQDRREAWTKEVDSFLGKVSRVLFVPYAGFDYDEYVRKVESMGLSAGRKIEGIHTADDPVAAVLAAEAIFVGGGNTFRLTAALYRLNLINAIRDRVRGGVPYLGISAGSNLACPSIKTTNDMPIVYPPSFEGLNLFPLQINPHYFAGPLHYETPEGLVRYGGETRDDRLREFHQMNEVPVLGLWEGSIVRVENDQVSLRGTSGCRVFRPGQPPEDRTVGANLTDLLP